MDQTRALPQLLQLYFCMDVEFLRVQVASLLSVAAEVSLQLGWSLEFSAQVGGHKCRKAGSGEWHGQ